MTLAVMSVELLFFVTGRWFMTGKGGKKERRREGREGGREGGRKWTEENLRQPSELLK